MNLISCDNCGVVVDDDKLPFADLYDMEYGDADSTRRMWDNESNSWLPTVPCPVCKIVIKKKGGR